ncbi:putative peptidoglycan binding protein [Motilibacter peucedani]|uniref:Putative peptidoglycan binding protein n=1 Tax=Motilibacter peucedani TaxID=598650 RepID=A0A420XKE1_9ACTN|nr:peptidoglycan-binding protein [Motilibacter peucedani]RKS68493.1 putative peptidoglycan binding protein [Motilibacter peucedani]
MPRRLGLLLLAVLALLPLHAAGAQAATGDGGDVSWPQCPHAPGYGLPMPGAGAGFVVVGLTQGRPYAPNPCLDTQLAHVARTGARLGAYTFAAMPTAAQLRATGATGPYDSSTRAGRLSNAGYAQGLWSAGVLAAHGIDVPMVWLDVEHRRDQPWTKVPADNVAVITGSVRALQDRGLGVGFYSYLSGWREITGGLRSELPVWATAGRRGRSAALAMCTEASFSGGPVVLAQWYDSVRDSDLVCPGAAPAARALPLLRRGSHGPAVVELRTRLGLPPAEQFSRATALAVRAFQRAHGLAVDGVVGPQTWGALRGGPAPDQWFGRGA